MRNVEFLRGKIITKVHQRRKNPVPRPTSSIGWDPDLSQRGTEREYRDFKRP